MERIDEILERYEDYLKRAEAGMCKKVAQRIHFRDFIRKMYKDHYETVLEEIKEKLQAKKHVATVEEKVSKENHFVFTLGVMPRHLMRCPVDRYYPSPLMSSISFIANEFTLTIDIETVINPSLGDGAGKITEKIAVDELSHELFMKKVGEFLEKVFEETIILDFKE